MFKGRKPNKTATVPPKCTVEMMDMRVSVSRDSVPYEPLLTSVSKDGVVTYYTDVDLLFNQERLDRMSLAALKQKLDENISAGDTGLSEIRKNIKDEDLQKFVKSRYIQSLSELRQWSHYLTTQYANEVGNIRAAAVEAAQKAVAAAKPAADGSGSPAPKPVE